jgi:hypothetical protein
MYIWEIYGIAVVVALVGVAAVFAALTGKGSLFAQRIHKQIRELEVKIRIDTDERLVQDLREIAALYLKVQRQWEAEQALQRALTISKQEWGDNSPLVIEILKDFIKIMRLSNHKSQARFYSDELRRMQSKNK